MWFSPSKNKLRRELLEHEVKVVADRFGRVLTKPALELILSEREEASLRRRAIEAFCYAGEEKQAKTVLSTSLEKLSADLRAFFFETAFSQACSKEIKRLLIEIAYFGFDGARGQEFVLRICSPLYLRDDPLSREVRTAIMRSQSSQLTEALTECLQFKQCLYECRSACLDMLIAKEGIQAVPALVDALKIHAKDAAMAHRLVESLEKHEVSGASYDSVLVEVLKSLEPIDPGDCVCRHGLIGDLEKRLHGFDPDPLSQVLKAISRVGGKSTLTTMLRVLTGSKMRNRSKLMNCILVDDPNYRPIEAIGRFEHGVETAIRNLHSKLRDCGEIKDEAEVPGLEEFLKS